MVMNPMAESVTKYLKNKSKKIIRSNSILQASTKKTSVTCGHPNLQNIFHMEIPIRESYSPLGTE